MAKKKKKLKMRKPQKFKGKFNDSFNDSFKPERLNIISEAMGLKKK